MNRHAFIVLCRKFSFINKIVRNCSTSTFNPHKMQGSVVLQVLGSGSNHSPKVVYLFTNKSRYLFNCGEGTQRLAHEHKTRLSRLEHIFITSLNWENIGGLPGISLTLQDIGVENITLHGPPGLDELFVATQKFAVLNTMSVKMAGCSTENVYNDNLISVKYVPLQRKSDVAQNTLKLNDNEESLVNYEIDNVYYDHEYSGNRTIKQNNMQSLLTLPRKESFVAMSFICRLKDRLGCLDLQKCVDRGLKPGPLLGQLKNGQDVTLPDGKIIYAHEVKSPDEPGAVFIVIDVPDMQYLDSLLESNEFQIHQEQTATSHKDLPNVIIHFTPNYILQNEKYQSFMKTFPDSTNHLIVNDSNTCLSSAAIHRLQQKLHLLDNEIFPPVNSCNNYLRSIDCLEELKNITLDCNEDNKIDDIDSNVKIEVGTEENKIIKAKTLMSYILDPKKGLDRSSEVKIDLSEYVSELFNQENFSESLKNFHLNVSKLKQNAKSEKYPIVVFLGTGSCIPNKTRNTSGIMIHINENNCMLLDCGEGTFGQLAKFYGTQTDGVLRKLKTIYVSHLHADHHIGLIQVLKARKQALLRTNSLNDQSSKICLLAPKQMEIWLKLYDRRFERIYDLFELLPNQMFEKIDKSPDELILFDNYLKENSLFDLRTCFVRHCPNAFGITLITDKGKKITYSGDTMPCEALVKMGFNSDILIHEATMEDDLHMEAVKKMHSTIGQAIEISKKMEASNTILTHFSQRYARIPRFSEETEKLFCENNIGIAFDNMKVTYDKLCILPHMYACLKLMFADHYEELENRAVKRALKRSHTSTNELERNVLKKNKQKGKKT